ncbi:YhcH/YjgK/YiaL family protein [Flavobacterium piscinae]|uniref:DUF386 family protein n=1 Tax=Flavobacterium piscinae TaxID=2506424 RepID=A0A4Q1KTT6_9FLAO|nr:YhcH/YjgK/YiaL family protein [Flavobacterium piscinae]MBC8883223.1 YhcH/YjgK/YiaL family protein [Flavobacterium piscinae]RXR33085.1 DUF386 family protein [Flavobacterium piscinae]
MSKIGINKMEALHSFFNQNELDFIKKNILRVKQNQINFGEWFIYDESLKLILLNSSNLNDEVKEFHKINTDVHLTISGKDTFYIGDDFYEVLEDNLNDQDYCLVKSNTEHLVEIYENQFVIVKPGIIHCNVLDKEAIKLVIKKKNA